MIPPRGRSLIGEVVPLGPGSPVPREQLLTALASRAGDVRSVDRWADQLVSELETGRIEGRRFSLGARGSGFALWDGRSALGANVQVLYAEPGVATAAAYGALLDAVASEAGRIAFAPGRLPGLTEQEEASLLRGRGYAPYGRSELRLPPESSAPDVYPPAAGRLREIRVGDEKVLTELHRRAYRWSFDRYLFLEEMDEERDSAREVGDTLGGRWGPPEPPGSVMLEDGPRALAAVIAVRRPDGVLIADVAVDPEHRGRGLGRAVLTASLRGLRGEGVRTIYLNVTEGNTPALALYRSVGFVRSLGPTRDWYDARLIPVRP